jgi:hypothetical protein
MTITDRLVWIDEITDRELASDGVSRYGAYLRQGAHRFLDWNEAPTSDPAAFTATAFEIACSPVMSPPYVVTYPRVLTCVPHRDEDGRRALQVDLAMGLPARMRAALPPDWRGWQQTSGGMFYAPWDNDCTAVYATVTVRLPFPAADRLPGPAYDHGDPHTPTVHDAVRVLVAHANTELADLLTAITGGDPS